MRVAIEVQDGGARGWPGGTSGKHKSDQTASGKATDRAVIDETVSDKNSRGYKTSGTKSSQPTEKSKSSDKTKSSTAKSTSNKYGSTRGGPVSKNFCRNYFVTFACSARKTDQFTF